MCTACGPVTVTGTTHTQQMTRTQVNALPGASVGDLPALLPSWSRHLRAANLSLRTVQTYQEAARQFAASPSGEFVDRRDRAILLVFIDTGARLEEAAGLRLVGEVGPAGGLSAPGPLLGGEALRPAGARPGLRGSRGGRER
jgi:hypothetical protein